MKVTTDAVQLLDGGHDDVEALITARGLVDLVIPRGGAGLIRAVVEESTVPVIETGEGNVHIYLGASAPEQMAVDLVVDVANVLGSRPDGWWRDRAGAAAVARRALQESC